MDEYLYSKIFSFDPTEIYRRSIERCASFLLVLLRKSFNFELFFPIKVLDKSVELVGLLLLIVISVCSHSFFLFFSIDWLVVSARIITNFIQTKDMNMVINLLISFILNLSIVIACTIYPNNPRQKSTNDSRKETTPKTKKKKTT